jgi:hypothetical protein
MFFLLILENSKIYINSYITIAPTCSGLQPSSGGLHLRLAEVTLTLKQSVKLRRYETQSVYQLDVPIGASVWYTD